MHRFSYEDGGSSDGVERPRVHARRLCRVRRAIRRPLRESRPGRWHDRLISRAGRPRVAPSRPSGTACPVCRWSIAPIGCGKVLVEDVLVREARRCRELWHSLQELGGVHNSHARRGARAESARRSHTRLRADRRRSRRRIAGCPSIDRRRAPAAGSPDAARPTDDPYIETPRCSTCNECTQINNRMFAYNENKQAFIADPPPAPTVSSSRPRRVARCRSFTRASRAIRMKPGLEELLKRAEAFL